MPKIAAIGKRPANNPVFWMLSEIKKQTALPVAVKKESNYDFEVKRDEK